MNQSAPISRMHPVRISRSILRWLAKISIHLEPFVTVREGENSSTIYSADDRFRFGFMPEDEIDSLVGFGPSVSHDKLNMWHHDGKRCFAAWDGSRLAAKMWCDFKDLNFPPNLRSLENDEAYLFAAYSHPDYRGQNLAPQMRLHCYDALRELGRTKSQDQP